MTSATRSVGQVKLPDGIYDGEWEGHSVHIASVHVQFGVERLMPPPGRPVVVVITDGWATVTVCEDE